ncbi:MAG: TonB-dependent receptor, partial [Mariniphaga sp.]|nr:TonB-dependent receptor [Mariniphaga sp.]
QPQKKSISGKVTDEKGQTLPGASVVVKGTTIGIVTDSDGNYTLAGVPGNAVLQFSFVGMKTQEIVVGGKTTVNITLAEDAIGLEEVVAVGYGTMKKSDVTGSVSSVSKEILQSRPVSSFEDALKGRTSGVQIRQTSGDLNGAFSIAIRGVGSVTGSNDPLIVVDGVPLFSTNFSSINPKDIASIDILKDASATAIFGSRASNGVVMISTKKGNKGKMQLTLDTDFGFEQIAKRYDVMSTEQQRLLFVEAFKNSNRSTAIYDDPTNPFWKVDTNWQELGTQTAIRQNYNLGFNGGNEKTDYSGSASYLNREGTLINTNFQSWSLRINVGSQINDWLKLTTNMTGSHQIQNSAVNDTWNSTGYRSLIFQHTYTQPYDENRKLTAVNTTAASYFGANENPLINLLLPTRNNFTTRILGNTKLDVTLMKELVLSGNIGSDIVLGDGYIYLPVYSIGMFNSPLGSVTGSYNQQINWVGDLTLNYEKKIDKHSVKALLGFSAQQFTIKSSSTTGTGTVNNALNQLSNQTNFSATGTNVSAGLLSTFARLNYDFSGKYLATATIRRDGSSKFGPDNRYGLFPSGSVAWRVSKENFLKSSKLINDLKFRVSYGQTGNQNIGDFAFITKAWTASYVFGNSVVVGNAPLNIGNPNLKWEAAVQFDAGFDISLYEGRIYTSLDYYNKQSQDLLISAPIPLTSGVSQNPIVNLGSVKNTGLELTLNTRNLVGPFSWTTNFNISFNKNTVLDIGTNSIGNPLEIPGESIPLSNQPTNLTKAGHPAAEFYMYKYVGNWQLGQEAEALAWSGASPGDPRYADLNKNGKFDVGDKTFVGNPNPKYFGGMDNTFSFKQFSLSIFTDFAGGYELYNTARNLFSRGVPFVQNLAEVADFWTPTNPSNTVPRPSQGGNTTTLATMVSTRFLENADYIRLKNVRLSYDLPSKFLGGKIIQTAKFTITGSNLITFTNYSGLDPEASSRSSLLSAGIDYTPYPPTRLVSLAVQLTF